MTAEELDQWAKTKSLVFLAEVPDGRLHELLLQCHQAGLEEALKVVSGGPSFLTKKNIKDLITEVQKAKQL